MKLTKNECQILLSALMCYSNDNSYWKMFGETINYEIMTELKDKLYKLESESESE